MVSIRPTDVGKRVSIQFFSDAGEKTEAVGVLEQAVMDQGDVILHVRRKDDSLVAVPLRRLTAGKVVRPRPK